MALVQSSVAGRVGVIAAAGAIVGIGTCRRRTERRSTDRSSSVWNSAIPGTARDVGMIHDGQQFSSALTYAPLSPAAVSAGDAVLKSATYDGKPILQ